jgi:brefeldin A-inhibited guanine nucleotide-exchange protein
MAYELLRGNMLDEEAPVPEGGAPVKLIDSAISLVATCFEGGDDFAQLQIVKVVSPAPPRGTTNILLQTFLTAVSSSVCQVHEQALMLAVRTCYNIFLVSKNQVNQATAKATLMQMLSISFDRLEESTAKVSRARGSACFTFCQRRHSHC